MATKFQPTADMNSWLVKAGNMEQSVSAPAMKMLTKALAPTLRKGIMSGDILFDIFQEVPLAPGAYPEFPLDMLPPGTEKDFYAYTISNQGYIPQRSVESDYVMVPTYPIAHAIDWLLRYARDARWDIVGRAMEIFEAGFTKKKNDDGWHTLLYAGVDRNIVVFDGDANAGQFTKRLVSLMKTVMRRNGGGNSTSMNRGLLTDLYVSPESFEDMRNWGPDQVDNFTQRSIFLASDEQLNNLFGVNIHPIDELGEGQEYQTYFTGSLAGSLASGDVELVVGLDQSKNDSFVMPVRQNLEVFDDPTLHREQRAGVYGWMELGFASLDGRRVLLGSY